MPAALALRRRHQISHPGETLSRQVRAQEAGWRPVSDLRSLRDGEQIRDDRERLRNTTRMADAELKALQAVRRQVGGEG